MKYKLILLAAALAVALAAPADAQLRAGVKGGIGFSTFVGVDPIHLPLIGTDVNLKFNEIRDGLAGGGFVTLQLARWFAIQPEFLYVQKGGKKKILIADVTWKVDYFEIPILARLNIPLGGSSLYFFGGPTLAFNMSSKIEASVLGQNVATSIPVTRTADWDVTAGLGFEVPTGPLLLSLDARYTLGLTDVLDLKNKLAGSLGPVDIPNIWKGRNGTLLLLLGIGFQLEGRHTGGETSL